RASRWATRTKRRRASSDGRGWRRGGSGRSTTRCTSRRSRRRARCRASPGTSTSRSPIRLRCRCGSPRRQRGGPWRACGGGGATEEGDRALAALLAPLWEATRGMTPLRRMLYLDTRVWLPDDLLMKADKITMATAIELRVPLLDHRLVEYAWSLPDHYKVRE